MRNRWDLAGVDGVVDHAVKVVASASTKLGVSIIQVLPLHFPEAESRYPTIVVHRVAATTATQVLSADHVIPEFDDSDACGVLETLKEA